MRKMNKYLAEAQAMFPQLQKDQQATTSSAA